MIDLSRAFNRYPTDSPQKTSGNASWAGIFHSFLVLGLLIWVNELLDIPHLLFGAEKTPMNLYEALSETFIIVVVGVFAISRMSIPSAAQDGGRSVAAGKIRLPLVYAFVLLAFFIWFNELLDLPHSLFSGQSTPVNWIEAAGETLMIFIIGSFSVSMLTRNAAMRELAESRARREMMFTNTVIQTAPVFFVAINPEGRVITMNDEMLRVLGYTREEVKGRDYLSVFVPEKDHGLTRGIFSHLVESHQATRNENRVLTKEGEELLVEWFGRPVFAEDGTLSYFFGVGTDITSRKRYEADLHSYQEQLRKLNIHAEQVRERERKRIARELHDELGQLLTVLKMDLAYVEKKLPDQRLKLGDKITEMHQRVDATMGSLKRIMTDLRPPLLDNIGLVAAIEWQAKEFQSHTGIECSLSVDTGALPVDQNSSTALFRIFQETLTNVARHARATRVTVSLAATDRLISLTVQDNGTGIPPEKISDPESFGLMGIRERVKYYGGEVRITGSPGQGTTVAVTILMAGGD